MLAVQYQQLEPLLSFLCTCQCLAPFDVFQQNHSDTEYSGTESSTVANVSIVSEANRRKTRANKRSISLRADPSIRATFMSVAIHCFRQ